MSQKLHDNERIKIESNFLRGKLVEGLNDNTTGAFIPDDVQLVKFHGLYQQDHRDYRAERKKQKLEPLYSFLLRARLPGGVVTPEQWLEIDRIAEELTDAGSIRITTRQTFQYHGIYKRNLKSVFQELKFKANIDSMFTAGDVNRNTICTSNPEQSELHTQVYELSKKISEHFLPKSNAYAEIWLDGEKVHETEQEPIYGNIMLPRKFKIAVALPPYNDVDIHGNDLNFVAIIEGQKIIGYNVVVGAGLGMTHGDKTTFPRLGDDFGFIAADKVIEVAEAVVTTQRDLGNRVSRAHARVKYTLETHGVEKFKGEVESRSGIKFAASRPYQFTERGDRIGWIKGIDNKWHLTVFIENGRILDYPGKPLKSGLVKIAKVHQGTFRMTANQNLIIASVPEAQKETIEALARECGLIDDGTTNQRKYSMACVALPTCPLAMAEAERYLPALVTDVEALLTKHGIGDDHIILRVTGCPNGCARPMLAEVGLIGKAPGRYNLYLGGNTNGTRLPKMYKENIDEATIITTMDELIGRWANERESSECFGDFVIRAAIVAEVIIASKDFHD
ncbi:sulfite reductase subunit beta [Psychromonas sp. MB-3u-54]|uniref:assimilatory sulfite reductase (NADPH) hemoprotein subunit n=1 Tax=Psychromonas sp. MB-3u-54 TaxID=2058319 RepID=UPI000C320B05|nr:assimilatory sulfite reductase (NADPH) hemoprotein subunit [Psychromonas sp. MB-3u-54]PKH01824.1 sulfite reductase subunit beta [Psychromonas sp. MB-3u-54]